MVIDRRTSMMFCCAALLTVSSGSSLHASCEFTPQGEGRVSAILDTRTLRLDDGREVTLHGADDRPDRYGRQSAFVFPKDSGVSIQSELLARGEALASATIADKACSITLLAAEATARTARRGIWAGSAALKNAERPDDILAGKGRFAVVEGTISSARLVGGTFYVNFGRRWTRDFAVTISRRMMPSFETAGIDLKSLKDKRVRVRGWIEERGGPRIEATHPGQIELIAAADMVSRDGSAARNFMPKDEGK